MQIRDISFDFIETENKFTMNIRTETEVMQILMSEGDLLSMIKAMVETIWRTKDLDILQDMR